MKKFKSGEELEGMKCCIKKPIVLRAMQINEEFICENFYGEEKGKAGDYLVEGVDDSLHPCDKAVFRLTYDWVEND